MFKYLVALALVLVAVSAAPPAGPIAAGAPKDLNTANQLLYSYGYGASPYYTPYAYTAGYAGYPYGYAYVG